MEQNYEMPKILENKVKTEGVASLKIGKAARTKLTVSSTLLLVVVLVVMSYLEVPNGTLIAVTLIATGLCVIYAIMSMSASLNFQFDMLTLVVNYYSNRGSKTTSTAAKDSVID